MRQKKRLTPSCRFVKPHRLFLSQNDVGDQSSSPCRHHGDAGRGLVDLALTTHQPPGFTSFTLRTSPTLWYCAAEYVLAKGNLSPDPALEEPSPFRRDIIAALETARVSWHLAHGASSLSGVKAAVKAGLGVTARPVEMMSPDLRVAGISEGLPALPDTRYVVSCNPRTVSELPQAIFQSLSREIHPWETGTALT